MRNPMKKPNALWALVDARGDYAAGFQSNADAKLWQERLDNAYPEGAPRRVVRYVPADPKMEAVLRAAKKWARMHSYMRPCTDKSCDICRAVEALTAPAPRKGKR